MSRKRKQEDKSNGYHALSMDQFLKDINLHMSTPDNGYEDSKPVEMLMRNLKYVAAEWEKYALFSAEHYTRNLVATKDFTYDLIILCWQPGQKSAVHDHRESGCWMRMLTGELTETRYKVAETKVENGSSCDNDHFGLNEEHLVKLSEKTFSSGDVFYINNGLGLHRVCNPSKEQAISLHLYSPPIMDCEVWLDNGPQIFKTSLHSIFGMRLPQHMFKPKPTNALGGKYWPLAIPRNERPPMPSIDESHSVTKKQKLEEEEIPSISTTTTNGITEA
jgi:cysteine dioxygenase